MKPLVTPNFETDNSDRTTFVKDRLLPNLKSSANAAAGALGGAVLGAGVGLAGRKMTRAGYKALISSDLSKRIGKTMGEMAQQNHELYAQSKKIKRAVKKPVSMFFGPELAKARALAAAGAGAATMAPKGKEVGRVIGNVSDLKKQYVAQFGVEPSEAELLEAAKLNPNNKTHRKISKYFYTPNAMTKSTTRNIRQMYNAPKTIGKNPDAMTSMVGPVYQQMHPGMANFRTAQSESADMEKIAGLKEKIYESAKLAKSVQNVTERASKIAPYVGAGIGASLALPPAYLASKGLVSDDDKRRSLKRTVGTVGGATVGGAIGAVALNDAAGLVHGVVSKASNPIKTGLGGVNKYKDIIKNVANIK